MLNKDVRIFDFPLGNFIHSVKSFGTMQAWSWLDGARGTLRSHSKDSRSRMQPTPILSYIFK